MRVNINSPIKFCYTRTDPAAETKSIGCSPSPAAMANKAGRRASALFFARHLDCFIMTWQLSSIYRDLVHLDNFIVTRQLQSIYQDWQKNAAPRHGRQLIKTAGPLCLSRPCDTNSHYITVNQCLTRYLSTTRVDLQFHQLSLSTHACGVIRVWNCREKITSP